MENLPVEVVIQISSYLNTYDLMEFCKAYENYIYLLQERDIVRTIDFSGKYEVQNIHLYNYITTNMNYRYIKVLKINYIYWMSGQDLRRLIKQLEHLEVLYAIDTKLGLKYKDVVEYFKLRKLAVSVEDSQFQYSQNLQNLKSLCLKITLKTVDCNKIYSFSILNQLEEVWILDDAESFLQINYGNIGEMLSNLKKFVIKSRHIVARPLPYYCNFTYTGLVKVFECKRTESARELVFEKKLTKPDRKEPSIFEPAENDYERSWEIFQRLHEDVPYGPKESQICWLYINCNSAWIIYLTKSIKDVFFEDLNFCHLIILCNPRYLDVALKILSFKNSSKLKRLSFRSCLFQDFEKNPQNEEEPSFGFKNPRKGVQINSECHPFYNTANNLKNLRELEILTCTGCVGGAVISAYPLIAMFEYLEKLTLEIPLLLDGTFLKEVFIKCSHLESLYLLCKTQNDEFVINLCQNLKYSQNLRHFRLDHNEVPISKLVNSFNEIKNKKLLRICVKCDILKGVYNKEQSFSVLMESNPQLIFCCFVISENTKTQNSDIQRIMHKYKDGNPAKVFFVGKEVSPFIGVFPIPIAHHDIIFYRTNIGGINIDEF